MTMPHRLSSNQKAFDMHARGWAFLELAPLKKRVALLENIAKQLAPEDIRHVRLGIMQTAIEEDESGKAKW